MLHLKKRVQCASFVRQSLILVVIARIPKPFKQWVTMTISSDNYIRATQKIDVKTNWKSWHQMSNNFVWTHQRVKNWDRLNFDTPQRGYLQNWSEIVSKPQRSRSSKWTTKWKRQKCSRGLKKSFEAGVQKIRFIWTTPVPAWPPRLTWSHLSTTSPTKPTQTLTPTRLHQDLLIRQGLFYCTPNQN